MNGVIDPVLLATLSGLVSSVVAIVKSVVPEIDGKYAKTMVLIVSGVVFGVAWQSGQIAGSLIQDLATFVSLAAGALGIQTGVQSAIPASRHLPQIRKPQQP